ncbi:ejaculatory bulb-specific protein 3 [Halyomorpha halys]|uniref:ejaculatory bulb-specific protein 3 n=1 Tax=Halyomorpha halys TaxID=286706 RepID=UPI0006D4CDF3|nr:ejaculatory bulb-specific protein 3 [Halyomorpha halys]
MTDKMMLVLSLLMVSVAAALPADTYTTKYDNLDVGEILKNDRLYQKYNECLSNTGTCTPDGKELKDILGEIIKTDCKKCSEKQKKNIVKFLKQILEEKPEDFVKLEKIYDPDQVFRKKYAS